MCCRGGFYVRSLVRDLGRAVGCPAHVVSLRRTAIAAYADPAESERVLIQGEALLSWAPARRLMDEEADALRQGRAVARGELTAPSQALPAGFPDPASPIRALHRGRLVALLCERDGGLHTIANLRGGL